MRALIAIAALVASVTAIAQTQVPNVFQDGTPASAAEVNENFQYVLENASGGGGCSATQQENSVVIECADGTSGVLAGAGTVVVLPEGTVGGTTDLEQIAVGDFYWEDGNQVLIAEYYGQQIRPIGIEVTLSDPASNVRSMRMHQVNETQSLYLVDCCMETTLDYADVDCQGTPWASVSNGQGAFRFNEQWWVFQETTASGQQTLTKSYRRTDRYTGWDANGTPGSWQIGECVNRADPFPTSIGVLPAPYQPPAEWLNAAYPLTLVKKP